MHFLHGTIAAACTYPAFYIGLAPHLIYVLLLCRSTRANSTHLKVVPSATPAPYPVTAIVTSSSSSTSAISSVTVELLDIQTLLAPYVVTSRMMHQQKRIFTATITMEGSVHVTGIMMRRKKPAPCINASWGMHVMRTGFMMCVLWVKVMRKQRLRELKMVLQRVGYNPMGC